MRRSKIAAEHTRQRLLEEALAHFDRDGYAQASLSAIARAAGVTRGAIYGHFANKEDILAALVQKRFPEIHDHGEPHFPDTWPAFAAHYRDFFTQLAAEPERLRLLRVLRQHHDAPGEAPCIFRERYEQQWQSQCLHAIRHGQQHGFIDPAHDADFLVFALGTLFSGLLEQHLAKPPPADLPAHSRRLIDEAFARLQYMK